MWARLVPALRRRFSETARSRPRSREARGNGSEVGRLPPVRARRLADDLGERPAERSHAREADVEADLRDAALALAEQEHRALDPPALQVPVRRLAERRAE